jgi:hypothetical protein
MFSFCSNAGEPAQGFAHARQALHHWATPQVPHYLFNRCLFHYMVIFWFLKSSIFKTEHFMCSHFFSFLPLTNCTVMPILVWAYLVQIFLWHKFPEIEMLIDATSKDTEICLKRSWNYPSKIVCVYTYIYMLTSDEWL